MNGLKCTVPVLTNTGITLDPVSLLHFVVGWNDCDIVPVFLKKKKPCYKQLVFFKIYTYKSKTILIFC